MLYLIPNWNKDTKLEEDRMYTLSKFFSQQSYENKVLLTKPLQFLRYKLNSNGYNYDNVISIFDMLQNINTKTGHPLSLEDIAFPLGVDRIYTPNGVTILQKDEVIAIVYFNEFGFVSRVHHYSQNRDYKRDIYDERGFISEKWYVSEDNTISHIDYYNEHNVKTMTQVGDSVTIEAKGNPFLKNKSYEAIDRALQDILDEFILKTINSDLDSVVSVITSADKAAIDQTKGLSLNGKMIRIVTEDTIEDFGESEIVIDSKTTLYQDLSKSSQIPIFTPKLTLGNSNEMSLMKIYLKLSTSREKERQIFRLNLDRIMRDEQVSVICELEDYDIVHEFRQLQKTMIDHHFEVDSDSVDYQKVEKYIIAKREKRLFTKDVEAVKIIQQSKSWINYVKAVNTHLRIAYIVNPDRKVISDEFKEARIYLDFEDDYNMLRHAKAVSNGIPIITQHRSDYIIEGENGFYIQKSIKETDEYLDYFLDNLRNWNKALVCSVDIIEKHEPDNMMSMWMEIMS